MKFTKLDAKPNLPKVQEEMLEFWKNDDTFHKSVNKQSKGEKVFYDGPPFPTGMPHHGTVLVSFIKDMISRYFTMKGYRVARSWGWDCHGLPIEHMVEKKLELSEKSDIEQKIGISKFNEECFNVVSQNNDSWRDYILHMARWVDYDKAYKTMDLPYMESVLWTFKTCYDKGYIYKDYRVTPYCFRCQTPLSLSETRESDSTRPRQDRWTIANFELDENFNDKKVYMLAWTTTPWTLPSNMALAVNADLDYAYVDMGDKIYIAGKNALSNYVKVFGKEPQIIKVIKGKELENKTYKPLLSYFAEKKKDGAFKVICADYVADGEGLSVVHTAPAFGEDDYWACKRYNIPLVNPVNEKGEFTSDVPDFAGRNVIEANSDIIRFLYSKNLICADGTIEHNYPHCWRCKNPLIYKAMDAWYFGIEKLKPKLLEKAQEINWIPSIIKDGRFGNWLENARDWNISRNRYWSTPFPVWTCEKCGKVEVLGSIKEIYSKSGMKLDNLHRQYMDKVVYDCECGGKMKRIPEVLDCWFESGSAPHARLHYPFENKEWFDTHSPSDFVVEYTGQIRCWFYFLHVLSTALFDKPAYKNAIVHGTVLAEDGKKLSKSSKNYTDPMYLMKNYGTDALRLYLYQSKAVLLNDLQFDDNGVKDQLKTIIIPLWNAFNFFLSYAIIDSYNPEKVEFPKSTNELDKWILALLYDVEKDISTNMDNYQIDKYVVNIVKLVDGLTNWYIRRSRRRFYSKEMTQDKKQGYDTMLYVLDTICKLLAPITPFLAEELYSHLHGLGESVHLQEWNEVPENYKDEKLLKEIDTVQKTIYLARVIREKNNVKNRQPLLRVMVSTSKQEDLDTIKKYEKIIAEEINVKSVELVSEVEKIATIIYKPNFNYIREHYTKNMGEINKAVAKKNFEVKENCVLVKMQEGELELNKDALLIDYVAHEGLHVLAEDGILVSLDLTLTEELLREGVAREIVRNIQDARKQLNCELTERISISFNENVPCEWIDYICNETLSDIVDITECDFTCEIETSNGKAKVCIKRNL